MNFRTTILLLIVLAGAGVFVWFVSHHGSSSDETQTTFDIKGKKLFDEKSDDVNKLTIRAAQPGVAPIVLEKQSGNWKLLQPITWGADSFEARGLVDSIIDLRSQGGVELNSANLSSTGLDQPRFTVEASDSSGKTLRLQIGNRSAIGSDLYVKVNDEKSGQLVAGSSLADKLDKGLDKLAETLRDKQLVKTESNTIHQIEITQRGEKKLTLQKQGEDWKITEPKQSPADSSQVSDLLFTVTGLRAEKFIDPKSPEASAAEFERPKAAVWFSTTPPTTQPTTAPATRPSGITVTFGQFSNVDRDKLFVKLSEPPIIAEVAMNQTSLDKLTGATVLSLHDKKVLDIDPAHVESFTLAVNRAATTQPTTKPAEAHELTIARRKESPPVMGPPVPATEPATQPAVATTQPATQPGQLASTQPTTRPAIAATQPAEPKSKWVFQSGGTGVADEGQVDGLLESLHPLRAEKFVENTPTTQPATQPAAAYTLTVRVGPHDGKGPQEFVIHFTSPGATGNLAATSEDLTFELERSILEKLDGDFKTPKPAAPMPASPSFSPGGFNPG